MGTIVISSNATLDGVVQDPDGEEGFERGGWFHQFAGSKDLEHWVTRETQEAQGAEALLMGGRTSEWFASRMALAGADLRVGPEWAARVKSMPKFVVSSAREDPRWSNVTLLNGGVVKEVSELKRKVAGEIVTYGSYQLVRTLMEHDLVDELRLVLFPVVLGSGLHLFDRTGEMRPLHLVDAQKIGDSLLYCAYKFA